MSNLFSFQSRFLVHVRIYVKVCEENEEEDPMHGNVVGKLPGEPAAVVEEELNAVQCEGDKLHHLHPGEVLLPPDVLLK